MQMTVVHGRSSSAESCSPACRPSWADAQRGTQEALQPQDRTVNLWPLATAQVPGPRQSPSRQSFGCGGGSGYSDGSRCHSECGPSPTAAPSQAAIRAASPLPTRLFTRMRWGYDCRAVPRQNQRDPASAASAPGVELCWPASPTSHPTCPCSQYQLDKQWSRTHTKPAKGPALVSPTLGSPTLVRPTLGNP